VTRIPGRPDTGTEAAPLHRPGSYRGAMRIRLGLLAVLGGTLLAACSSGGGDTRAEPSSAAPSSTAPAPAPLPPTVPVSCDGGEPIEVSDADGLQRALDEAAPGQLIRLADGRYEGNFTASAVATPDAPIRLCGDRGAVLDGGAVDGDYALHLSGAAYWQVQGLTVTGGQKGVMVDGGVGNRIEGLLVTSMGDEAVHLRRGSTDNVVSGNTIRNTGLRKPKYGEGVYVGTAQSNWCQVSDCRPDRSDRNVVEGNDIAGTTAEAVDIKEGTSGGVVRGNTFDGSAMVESDSLVDVKGNDWTVEGNTGTAAPGDAFQVHEVVDGWGRGTVFAGNSVRNAPGLLVNVAGPRSIQDTTTVSCDNQADGAARGLSNVPCQGVG
jgi:nitrous oxidase accessory protein NosD